MEGKRFKVVCVQVSLDGTERRVLAGPQNHRRVIVGGGGGGCGGEGEWDGVVWERTVCTSICGNGSLDFEVLKVFGDGGRGFEYTTFPSGVGLWGGGSGGGGIEGGEVGRWGGGERRGGWWAG